MPSVIYMSINISIKALFLKRNISSCCFFNRIGWKQEDKEGIIIFQARDGGYLGQAVAVEVVRFCISESQAHRIYSLMGARLIMRLLSGATDRWSCLLLRETCDKAGLAVCAYLGWNVGQITRQKQKMEAFIINMTILFYFPREFSKAYSKMYRQNREGNDLKRVKGLNSIRAVDLNVKFLQRTISVFA